MIDLFNMMMTFISPLARAALYIGMMILIVGGGAYANDGDHGDAITSMVLALICAVLAGQIPWAW